MMSQTVRVDPTAPEWIARLTDSTPPDVPVVPTLRKICSWCVDFDPTVPSNKGATHVCCPACFQRLAAELAKLEGRAA